MRTLGIDLAARPRTTAVCLIEWKDDEVEVMRLAEGFADAELLGLIRDVDAVGIDAPFGWPEPFINNLNEYADHGSWQMQPSERLMYRETDRAVRTLLGDRAPSIKLNALSVSSDRIAVCAWRCAALLTSAARDAGKPLDRVGARSRIFEVYPAASIESWGISRKGYKKSGPEKGAPARRIIVDRLRAELSWLDLAQRSDLQQAFEGSDDLLDAFVASLTARAAFLGLTALPSAAQARAASREGWIHVPALGSLGQLA